MSDGTDTPLPPPPPPAADVVNLHPASLFDELAAGFMQDAAAKHAPFGITAAMLGDYLNQQADVTRDQLNSVTEGLARKILRERVWDKIGGDSLPPAIAPVLFDIAARRSVDEAVKFLQRVMPRVEPMSVKADGRRGLQTLTALESLVKDGKAVSLAERMMEERDTLVERWRDGRLTGRKRGFGRIAILVGKTLLATKGIRIP